MTYGFQQDALTTCSSNRVAKFVCYLDIWVLVLVLFNYHIIRYVYFRDFKQKIYNKIKIAKIVKILNWGF